MVMGFCLIAVVVLIAVLLSRGSDFNVSVTSDNSKINNSSSDVPGDKPSSKLRFIGRKEWGARPPSKPLTKMKLPVPNVIISHTATDFCTTQSQCTNRVRSAQTLHMQNCSDIAWNFLIGGDGHVYVGRSWGYVGAHSYGYNAKSIEISFIGTFNTVKPPKCQLLAFQQLIDLGVKRGKISTNYKIFGHRQIVATLSPGNKVYNIVKRWSHWSPTP